MHFVPSLVTSSPGLLVSLPLSSSSLSVLSHRCARQRVNLGAHRPRYSPLTNNCASFMESLVASTEHQSSAQNGEAQNSNAGAVQSQVPAAPSVSFKGLRKAKAAATGNYSMEMLSKRKQTWAPLGAVTADSERDPEVERWLSSDEFQKLKVEKVLNYNTNTFPLQEAVVTMISSVEPRVREYELSQIHHALDPNFAPENSFKNAKKKINGHLYCSKDAKMLRDTFERFICDFLGPHVREILPCDRLVFQASPCLRLSPPSDKRIGHPHCDSMYYHQRGQINFWDRTGMSWSYIMVPLTRCYGSNTLWAESEPGKEDYRPLEVDYGQVVRFYGNRCTHFTLPNATPDTRVSFDMRVVPGPCFDPNPPESRGRDGKPLFTIGGYYGEAKLDEGSGTWSVTPGSVTHSHPVFD